MQAQIITIGDEILIGQIQDTNSTWLAVELTSLGFDISSVLSISDNKSSIEKAVDDAVQFNDLILLTGGLGPTNDDITKTTLCSLFNTKLEYNELVLADVESFISQRGGKMNSLNRDQSLFPVSAKLLRNRQGTAPGMWFEQNGSVVISLPGVPREMKGIFKQEIVPNVMRFFKLSQNYYQTVMVTGIAEAQLSLILNEWEMKLPKAIKLAYLPSPGVIRLRLGMQGGNIEVMEKAVKKEIVKLHSIIPEKIFSDTQTTMHEVVGKLLKSKGVTLSTAESCTGGSISQMITSVPGSSSFFKGGVVAYSNQIKTNLLDVSAEIINEYGAVSKEVVESMALGACNKLNTDYAISTSGIAGPTGGTDEKPVGLVWIAIAGPHGVISKRFRFGKERDINIKRSSIAALNMLRVLLLE